MVNAVEQVRQRLIRASAALERNGVAYAVIGGNAVAAWVATVDETAVRNTQDVDMLVRRTDLALVRSAAHRLMARSASTAAPTGMTAGSNTYSG